MKPMLLSRSESLVNRICCATLIAFLFLAGCNQDHACPSPGMRSVEAMTDNGEMLDHVVADALDGEFSGTVLVERQGNVLLHAGYGYADRESGCVSTMTEHAYWIGSLSKQFTAAAIVNLAEQEKLRLQDSIATYLPDVPDDKSLITIHQLLTHTSGLPNEYSADGNSDRATAISAVFRVDLDARPGERYQYSNDGYVLLAAIVEVVSNRSFENYLSQVLLDEMDEVQVGFSGDRGEWGRLDMAQRASGAQRRGSPQDWTVDWGYKGATGVLSTVGSLRTWFHQLREGKVLSAPVSESLFAAQTPTGRDGISYGYGWFRLILDDGNVVTLHSGDDDFIGHSSSLRWYGEQGLLVIVLSNSGYADNLPVASLVARDLATAALEGPPDAGGERK